MSAKRFFKDAEKGLYGDIAYAGLLQPVAATESATCGALGVDLAGDASDQAAVEKLLADFSDVFEKPAHPPDSRVKHRIDLIDEAK